MKYAAYCVLYTGQSHKIIPLKFFLKEVCHEIFEHIFAWLEPLADPWLLLKGQLDKLRLWLNKFIMGE